MKYKCPHCGWVTPSEVQEHELPVHHSCGGVAREDLVSVNGSVAQRPAKQDVEFLIATHCQSCPHFTDMCQLDKGCAKCKTPQTWRRAVERGRRCPLGRWGDMSICIATPSLELGGAEWWAVLLSQYLPQYGIRVAALRSSANGGHEFLLNRLQGTPVLYGSKTAFPDCDAVLSFGVHNAREHANGAKTIIVSHGSTEANYAYFQASCRADYYAGVSEPAADCTPGGCSNPIIHNGSEPERCEAKVSADQMRRRWGVPEGNFVIGYVGRITQNKGLIRLALAANRMHSKWSLVLIGPRAPCAIKHQLPKINPDIIYVDPVEQIGDALGALDVYCLPSESEAMSMSLCEAWLAGVRVVATPVGAIPEIERELGPMVYRVSRNHDDYELARALQHVVYADPLRHLAKRAQRVALEHFTASAMARRWAEYLKSRVKRCTHDTRVA